MNAGLSVSLAFFLGITAEAALIAWRSGIAAPPQRRALWACLGVAALVLLFALLPGTTEAEALSRLRWGTAGFLLVYALSFRTRVLPRLTERTLLLWTVLSLYLLLLLQTALPLPLPTFLALLILPAVALFFGLTSFQPNRPWRAVLYAWFLCLVALSGFWQLFFFLFGEELRRIGSVSALIAGMALCAAGLHLVTLLRFLPLPFEEMESWTEQWREWRSETRASAEEVQGDANTSLRRLLLLLFFLLILVSGFFILGVPEPLLSGIVVAAFPFLTAERREEQQMI
ncbi:MAG: hypothetical protein WCV62_06375 [Candidatus Peribacteraceae bacterium]|jgi:hypothetical protein